MTQETYSSPQNSSGGSEMKWTTTRIRVHPLCLELGILYLIASDYKSKSFYYATYLAIDEIEH